MSEPMKSPLEGKVVRPGFGNYSYYHSDRHTQHVGRPEAPQPVAAKKKHGYLKWLFLAAILVGAFMLWGNRSDGGTKQAETSVKSAGTLSTLSEQPAKRSSAAALAANHCEGNTLPKFIKIDITDRHLWACEGSKQVKDYPVITGMQQIPENATPPGTYKVYAKATDTRLTGIASTGAWNEPVNYWMPFLDNQYGTYGFHDAPWRKVSEFGNIDPNSTKGSHGCIQMETSAMGWVFNWSEPGTTLTITD